MVSLAASRLLQGAFEIHTGGDDGRNRLKASYLSFKERASVLSNEISRDFPDLTVHDESHLDALWELADLVVGPDLTINPLDAYVLGGAILLHDLGLAVAAYPGGRDTLREGPEWTDALTIALEKKLERRPLRTEIESAPEDIRRLAEHVILRQRHAAQAEQLAALSWTVDGQQFFLIEDAELRDSYGPLMGRLAHSHWWDSAALTQAFEDPMGPPSWCPAEWQTNPLHLACVLRVCDALHLDSRRAPMFLRAIREPLASTAKDHWKFQQRLARPYLDGKRFVFTAGKPFQPEDASAWWLCYDTLSYADRSIREVQALLADSDLPPLAVEGVKGVDDPSRLARLIRTIDWLPVDTDIQVSNVAELVVNLGGQELYGSDSPYVALRELIQNGADAVRARRVIESRNDSWGKVTVKLVEEEDQIWLEVWDSGIGMTQERLTGALLDFGQSFWGTGAVAKEFPGLLSSPFNPAGRYGIGFFSVFMLGAEVEVITRPFDSALADTQRLYFADGVAKRPILSWADQSAQMQDGGTCVRVSITDDVRDRLLAREFDDLASLCLWLCPSLDVSIDVVEEGVKEEVLGAGDWLEIDGVELLERNSLIRDDDGQRRHIAQGVADRLETLADSEGTPIARIALSPSLLGIGQASWHSISGVVTAGGFRASSADGIAGVLVGEPTTASRNGAIPIIDMESLSAWATRQAEQLAKNPDGLSDEDLADAAAVVLACNGRPGTLPICKLGESWVNHEELAAALEGVDSLILVAANEIDYEERERGTFELLPHVLQVTGNRGMLVSAHGQKGNLHTYTAYSWPAALVEHDDWGSLDDRLFEIVASAWQCGGDELFEKSRLSDFDHKIVVGERDGQPVELEEVNLLNR